MGLFDGLIVFVILWWVVLFTVLPFGAQPPEKREPGWEAGAPAKPRLLLKFMITTALALALTFLTGWIIGSGAISFRP